MAGVCQRKYLVHSTYVFFVPEATKDGKIVNPAVPTRYLRYKKSTRFAVEFFVLHTSRSIQESEGFFFPTSYMKGQVRYGIAKEAFESARAGL